MKNWIFEKMNFLYHSERIEMGIADFNPLNANHTKWSNTLKQFVRNLPTNCLSVFGHCVGLTLKGLTNGLKQVNFWKLRGYINLKVGGLKLIPNYVCTWAFSQRLGFFAKLIIGFLSATLFDCVLLIDISDICIKKCRLDVVL